MLEGEDEEERRRKTRRTRRNATGGEFGHGTRAGGSHYGTPVLRAGTRTKRADADQASTAAGPGLPASQPFAPGTTAVMGGWRSRWSRSNPDTSDRCFCGEDAH